MISGDNIGTGFDDAGRPVPSYWPDVAAEIDGASESARDEAALRREIVSRVFHFLLCGNPSAEQAGRRLHLLAYLQRQSPCSSQRELAEKLGISEAAVSTRLKSLVADLSMLSSDS